MTDFRSRLQAALGEGYRIEKELGGGGMSRVFLAEEVRLGRKVVVKVLPPEMAAGVNIDRFEREIQLAARLQHPHIVPLLSAGAEGDLLYYIMPYIEGESLRAKLAREGELPVGETVRILREVLDALQYAHSERVVHRDIKPDNVMISRRHALVTDFGVAKAVSESTGESSLTSLGVALGTPAYMAPEQAAADPHVDHRADLYAVGALAYEMLTGRPPFTGPTPQAVLAAHITQAPEAVTTHRTTVPPALNELILRCLAKKAADRPQRADDLIPHLDSLLTPTVGMTPTATQPVQAVDYDARAREAHPARVAALFLLASVGVLAIVYGLVQAIGLPDWVFYGAIGLLALGLPVMLYTSHHERQRAVARTTGLHVTTPVGLKRHFTRRKAMLGGGLAFAGLAIVVALFMVSRAMGIGPAATLLSAGVLGEQDRLLLADFDAQGADSALGETVTELTRIALAQSAAVTILESRQVSDVLTRMRRDPLSRITPELATEIAAREGIKAYLAGEIRPVGSGYVLSGRVVEAATGRALVTVRQTAANDDQIIRAVDQLAAALRGKIGESLRSVRADPPLERETTASLAALRLYAQATRVSDQGDYDRAIALLEQAVAEDSTFAMALRRIGAYYRNRGDPRSIALAREAMNRAYALRDRLSDRERYHVEAFQARMEEDYERALTSYLAILEKHPLDPTALNNAGAMLGALDRTPDALPYFRRAIEADVAPMITYTNLIGNVLWMGGVAEAESTLRMMTERMPDSPEIARMRSDIALARHDFQVADSAIRPLLSGVPSQQELAHWRLAELAWVGGRLDEAARSSREAVDIWARRTSASDDERRLRTEMANLEREVLIPADPEGLIRRLDALWADSRRITAGRPAIQRNHLSFAMMYAHAGAGARGRQVLEEYRGALDARERSRISTRGDLALIDGMVTLAENRVEDAFARLNEGCELWRSQYGVCEAGANPYLAEAYDRAGNADSALAIYERFTTLQVRNNASEWARVAPISRRLGELYEARGDVAKAIQHYGRFVELWRDADPRLQPMVRDARERIARLSRDAG